MFFSILIYFKITFIPVIKAEFSASLLQSSVHDPSEIILICWFIIKDGNSCAAYFYLFIYLEPVIGTFLGVHW